MTTMIREVYQAFREVGASEDRAAAAAEAIQAVRENDSRRIEDRLRRVEEGLADVKADVRLMKWMLGFLLALGLGNLLLLIRMAFGGPGG